MQADIENYICRVDTASICFVLRGERSVAPRAGEPPPNGLRSRNLHIESRKARRQARMTCEARPDAKRAWALAYARELDELRPVADSYFTIEADGFPTARGPAFDFFVLIHRAEQYRSIQPAIDIVDIEIERYIAEREVRHFVLMIEVHDSVAAALPA